MEEYSDDDEPVNVHVAAEAAEIVDIPAAAPPPPLPEMSAEQRAIVNAPDNVIVDAVAGSGKTTTVMHIAMQHKAASILLLTYNARLKEETTARSNKYGLYNLETRSYHSFCVKYINGDCFTDAGIIKHVKDAVEIPTFDIVIIDEAQDMTALYYEVALRALGGAPRIIVMGDRNQSIYQYKGADPRYLTLAASVFPSPRPWARLTLSVSYRITRQMAAMVNSITAPDTPRMCAVKDGIKPQYLLCSSAAFAEKIIAAAKDNPERVFILAPSVRNRPKHPMAAVANALTRKKVPLYIPNSDDRCPDDRVTRGKVLFSSFHQSKGLERDIVFVASFSDKYFEVSGAVVESCPNEIYVALTRATSELYVWHSCTGNSAPEMMHFIDPVKFNPTCDFPYATPVRQNVKFVNMVLSTGVTELLRHMPDLYSEYAMSFARKIVRRPPGRRIDISTVVPQDIRGKRYYEEVSDITGTASVVHFEITKTGGYTLDLCRADAAALVASPSMLLCSVKEKTMKDARLTFKNKQIVKHDWVTARKFAMMDARLANIVDDDIEFERNVVALPGFGQSMCVKRFHATDAKSIKSCLAKSDESASLGVNGRIDILTGDRIIEVKTVTQLQTTHFLQVLVYYYGIRCGGGEGRPQLYNVLTDELVELEIDDADLLKVMRVINHSYFHTNAQESDAEFISREHAEKTAEQLIATCRACEGTFAKL